MFQCIRGLVMLLLLLAVSTIVKGQRDTVTGIVLDAGSGRPVPAAAVNLARSGAGVVTPASGRFALAVAALPDTLYVSCLGYADYRLVVRANNLVFRIGLEPVANTLTGVTVSTGYQSLPKERATGAFVTVDSTLFNSRVTTGILDRLETVAPGLLFNRGTNGRGTEPTIRGQSTIYANAAPLIVVDNFPFEGDLSALNPNDIESVSLLKDAAAASIWGVRAGNGVLVITTKKGSQSRPLQVGLVANVSVGSHPNLAYDPAFIPAPAFMELEQQLFDQGFYNNDVNSPRQPPLSPYVALLRDRQRGLVTEEQFSASAAALAGQDLRQDLSRYFYRRPVSSQYLVSVSGAAPKANWYLSAGYDHSLPMQQGSREQRVTLHSQLALQPLQALALTVGIDYNNNSRRSANTLQQLVMGGPLGRRLYPYAALADAAGNPLPLVKDYAAAFAEAAPGNGFLDWQFRPLQELQAGDHTSTAVLNQLRVVTSMQYRLPLGLTAELRYQLEKGFSEGETLATAESYYARNLVNSIAEVQEGRVLAFRLPKGGIVDRSASDLTAHNGRVQLSYRYHSAAHDLTALAGGEWRQVTGQSESYRLYGYDPGNAVFQPVNPLDYYQLYPSGTYFQPSLNQQLLGSLDRFRSMFVNAAYSYRQRYTVSLSGRRDGSNYFGVATNRKTVPLWSAGVKWQLSKQPFYQVSWLPQLSLRLTYGYSGNLNKSITAFTTAAYATGDPYTGLPYLTITSPPNRDLRWEQTAMLNAGLDFGLAGNRLTGSIEYYHRKGDGIIGDAAIPGSTGYIDLNAFSNTARGNFAAISGYGWDIVLNSINSRRPLGWTTQFWCSYTRDRVTRYGAANLLSQLLYYGSGAGGFVVPVSDHPVYGIYSLPFAGLDASGNPQGWANGVKSTDYPALNNPAALSDLQYHGPARPVLFGGLTNQFSYKGWSCIINLSFKTGYYFKRAGLNYSSLFNYYQQHRDYLDRWQQPGDETRTSVPSLVYPADYSRDQFYTASAALVERGDHVRLQDIALSYRVDNAWLQRAGLRALRFSLNASQLGILWRANRQGLDPDYPTGIPPVRTWAIGLKADF